MDNRKVANELVKIAQSLNGSALDGMSKQRAKTLLGKIFGKYSKGLFSDDNWRPVHQIFKALENEGIDYVLTSAEYGTSSGGRGIGVKMPDNKTWKFEIPFRNDRGKETVLYGIIIASGAGSIDDPLSKYDVVAYAS